MSKGINIRVSDSEHRQIKTLAAQWATTIQDVTRGLLLDWVARGGGVLDFDDLAATLAEAQAEMEGEG